MKWLEVELGCESKRIAEAGQALRAGLVARAVEERLAEGAARAQCAKDIAAYIEHLETKVREQEEELEEMLKPDVERVGQMFGLIPAEEP